MNQEHKTVMIIANGQCDFIVADKIVEEYHLNTIAVDNPYEAINLAGLQQVDYAVIDRKIDLMCGNRIGTFFKDIGVEFDYFFSKNTGISMLRDFCKKNYTL